MFGVGSGIVAAPLLTRGFGKPQAVAQGLALALVAPGAVVALACSHRGEAGGLADRRIARHRRHGDGVLRGVAWAHRLPERQLRQLFAAMLLLTAALMIRRPPEAGVRPANGGFPRFPSPRA